MIRYVVLLQGSEAIGPFETREAADAYVRTDRGWRLKTRSMTFLRRSGGHDAGRPHDPLRPEPTAEPAG